MPLLDAAITHFETVQRALRLSPFLRRAGGVAFLLLVGCFQYLALPQLAKAPFYLFPLIPIAFLEPLPISIAFSVLAAAISLGADVLADPGGALLVLPYWSALARLIGFGLITTAISLAVGESSRLRLSERTLQEKVREMEETNRALGESMRELRRLQETLAAKERRVIVAEAAQAAAYEIERPLMSMSVFSEELLRLAEPDANIHPLAEKISERVEDMERILKGVREARKGADPAAGSPPSDKSA
jgi:signal transduction histidine kinase